MIEFGYSIIEIYYPKNAVYILPRQMVHNYDAGRQWSLGDSASSSVSRVAPSSLLVIMSTAF